MLKDITAIRANKEYDVQLEVPSEYAKPEDDAMLAKAMAETSSRGRIFRVVLPKDCTSDFATLVDQCVDLLACGKS